MAQLAYEVIIEQDESPTATDSQRSKSEGLNSVHLSSGYLDSISLPGQFDYDNQGSVSLHGRTSLKMAVPSASTNRPVSDVSTLHYVLSTSSPQALQSSLVAIEIKYAEKNMRQALPQSPTSQDNGQQTHSASMQYQSEDHQIVSPPEMSTVTNDMSQVAQETEKTCTSESFVFPQTPQVCNPQQRHKVLPMRASQMASKETFKLSNYSIGSDSVFTIEHAHDLASSEPVSERSQSAGPPKPQSSIKRSDAASLPAQVDQSTLPLGTGPRTDSLAAVHTVTFDPEIQVFTAGLDSMQRGMLASGSSPFRRSKASSSLPSNDDLRTVPRVDTTPPKVRWSSKLVGFLVHLFSFLIIYPLFFVLLPLLLVFKLLSCCIPCKKCHTVNDHLPPIYASRLVGTYYYTLVVFKESISFKDFCSSLATVLHQTSLQANTLRVLRLKLAAVLKTRGCFSWWRAENDSNLASHVHLVDRKMTTINDLSNYVAELLNSEPHGDSSLWAAYFIPTYIGRSAVVIKTHHCLASGTNLKNLFVELLDADHHELKPTFSIRKVSKFVSVLKAPSVFLRYLMRSTLVNDLHPLLLNGTVRTVYSEPYELEPIQACATKYGVTIGTVLLSCLTNAIRKLLLQSKATVTRDIPFALPVTTGSRLSFFSINLPVSEACPTKQLLKTNNLLLLHGEEASILQSTAKLASLFLCSSAIDSLSNTMLRKVTGVFSVIDLPNDLLYFDFYSVSAVACWPPHFSNVGLSVTIVCYKETFRICVATDKNVSEWPDILMSWFITSCSELVKSL